MSAFDTTIERVLDTEGGYVNDPKDPGGETQWGISKRAYPNVDIKALTRPGAIEIYKRDFWDRIGADKLPYAVSFQLMDFAVNSGIETAVRYLQRALGVADDGHWGPASQAAADKATTTDMIFNLLAERLDFMTRCKNWQDAGRGWARRIAKDMRYAAADT